jgi:hypothetical protein
MLPQKLLVDVGVGTFAGENRYQQRKSATKSTCTTFFSSLAVTSGSGRHLEAFFILRRRLQLALGARQIFVKGQFRTKLLAMSWQPAI